MANPKVRLLSRVASNLAPRFANTCWFSTRDWVAKNHAVALRFAHVMSDASAYVNTHPDDTLKDVLDYTGMDRAAALKMKRAVFSTTLSRRSARHRGRGEIQDDRQGVSGRRVVQRRRAARLARVPR
jgi:ABC-type nitrate/sulfonate/bicarbonate transport system substrate-binding protein